MPKLLDRRSRVVAAALLVSAVGLSGCSSSLGYATTDSWPAVEEESFSEELVLVVFSLESEFGDEGLLDSMWATEDAAMEALEMAGLGYIDGNEIGDGEYALYFYGSDRNAMWDVLKPIMQDAPIPLERVELWPTGKSAPKIVDFGDDVDSAR